MTADEIDELLSKEIANRREVMFHDLMAQMKDLSKHQGELAQSLLEITFLIQERTAALQEQIDDLKPEPEPDVCYYRDSNKEPWKPGDPLP